MATHLETMGRVPFQAQSLLACVQLASQSHLSLDRPLPNEPSFCVIEYPASYSIRPRWEKAKNRRHDRWRAPTSRHSWRGVIDMPLTSLNWKGNGTNSAGKSQIKEMEEEKKAKKNSPIWTSAIHLLEKVRPVFVAKKGHRVRQHPDVAPAAVVVRLWPPAVLVLYRQDLVRLAGRVVRVDVECWGETRKRERESD